MSPEGARVPQAETLPCGYVVGHREAEATRKERLILGAAGAGAAAVLLGFVVAFRRRRRS